MDTFVPQRFGPRWQGVAVGRPGIEDALSMISTEPWIDRHGDSMWSFLAGSAQSSRQWSASCFTTLASELRAWIPFQYLRLQFLLFRAVRSRRHRCGDRPVDRSAPGVDGAPAARFAETLRTRLQRRGRTPRVRIHVGGIADPLLDTRVPRLVAGIRRYRRCNEVALFSFSTDHEWRLSVHTGDKIAYLGSAGNLTESVLSMQDGTCLLYTSPSPRDRT